jgi:hypothetical protein
MQHFGYRILSFNLHRVISYLFNSLWLLATKVSSQLSYFMEFDGIYVTTTIEKNRHRNKIIKLLIRIQEDKRIYLRTYWSDF